MIKESWAVVTSELSNLRVARQNMPLNQASKHSRSALTQAAVGIAFGHVENLYIL